MVLWNFLNIHIYTCCLLIKLYYIIIINEIKSYGLIIQYNCSCLKNLYKKLTNNLIILSLIFRKI